jgi:hypothetical protein
MQAVTPPPQLVPLRPQVDLVAVAYRPHHAPSTRRRAADAPQQPDAVGADLQDLTPTVRQDASEGVDDREGRNVPIIQILCLEPDGAHLTHRQPVAVAYGNLELVNRCGIRLRGEKQPMIDGQRLDDAFRVVFHATNVR